MYLSQAKSVLGLGVDSAQNGPSQRRQTATAEAAFPVRTSGCLYQRLNDRESGCAVEPSSPSPEFPRNARLGPNLQIIDSAIIETLDLWHKNINSAGDWPGDQPGTTSHRINISMVGWLEGCVKTKTGHLVPHNEPLWTLVGFPRNPRDIEVR
jgi:hypothetical protein